MTLRLATWNVNSVRIRADILARFVQLARPDVLCLQEIKCRNGEFPSAMFKDVGLPHLVVHGQKGLHGVAIASRLPLEETSAPAICPRGEARSVGARVDGLEVHSLYIPAGGDVPDPDVNDKFAHKLAVLDNLHHLYAAHGNDDLVICGDFNVAPYESDVWSHKQLLDVVSHTPIETGKLEAARAGAGFTDLIRRARPEPEKLFTWWSYRSPDWTRNDRGRRLDHVWARAGAAARARDDAMQVYRDARAWEKPSDHVPVLVEFA